MTIWAEELNDLESHYSAVFFSVEHKPFIYANSINNNIKTIKDVRSAKIWRSKVWKDKRVGGETFLNEAMRDSHSNPAHYEWWSIPIFAWGTLNLELAHSTFSIFHWFALGEGGATRNSTS